MHVTLLLLSLLILRAFASQTPFQIAIHTKTPASTLWWHDLNAVPDANATSHLIFDTVNSVLQHWPHTRYRNGHSVIPGTVPVGTLLYHGRPNSSLPTVPEWTSTDPEHAYPFCSEDDATNSTMGGCWQLTLVATRPLKVLYFDGSSAANMRDPSTSGTLDAQDLIIWGKVDHERWRDERGRITELCAWGRNFGLDAFARMEMDFEVMLCDFTQGVKLVSADLLAAWWKRSISAPLWPSAIHDPHPSSPLQRPPPRDDPVASLVIFQTIYAGSWHNRYPGEGRIVLDLTRFISFYDTDLVPSLVAQRLGQERWGHRLDGISPTDLAAVTTRLGEVLALGLDHVASGIDWQTLFRVIVDRYADRLELLAYLLNTTNAANMDERALVIQKQLRVMLTPYILYTARPSSHSSDIIDDAWAYPVWQGCATKHTAYIHGSVALQVRLTQSERVLLRSFDETNREICRVVVRMWVAGVRAGVDPLIKIEQNRKSAAHSVTYTVEGWRTDTQGIMAWLDWSVWVKCRPACGPDEMCYLPTWPFFHDPEWKDDRWKRPQPRCIRKFEPYSQL
ncbi:hypothetical protein C8R47DRAFT_1145633 [Mycena vitilis]|nr:hypothetical protein C8R47DRAFT_1145633 [Mycena vitilis]